MAASSQIESVEDFIVYIDRDEGMPKRRRCVAIHRNSRVGYSFRFLDDSIACMYVYVFYFIVKC